MASTSQDLSRRAGEQAQLVRAAADDAARILHIAVKLPRAPKKRPAANTDLAALARRHKKVWTKARAPRKLADECRKAPKKRGIGTGIRQDPDVRAHDEGGRDADEHAGLNAAIEAAPPVRRPWICRRGRRSPQAASLRQPPRRNRRYRPQRARAVQAIRTAWCGWPRRHRRARSVANARRTGDRGERAMRTMPGAANRAVGGELRSLVEEISNGWAPSPARPTTSSPPRRAGRVGEEQSASTEECLVG